MEDIMCRYKLDKREARRSWKCSVLFLRREGTIQQRGFCHKVEKWSNKILCLLKQHSFLLPILVGVSVHKSRRERDHWFSSVEMVR